MTEIEGEREKDCDSESEEEQDLAAKIDEEWNQSSIGDLTDRFSSCDAVFLGLSTSFFFVPTDFVRFSLTDFFCRTLPALFNEITVGSGNGCTCFDFFDGRYG